MHKHNSSELTEDEILNLELLEGEKSSSYLVLLAFAVLIISANREKANILYKNTSTDTKYSPFQNPSQLVFIASALDLLANIMLGKIAFTRLLQRERMFISGEDKRSILPNVNISRGFLLVILGDALITLGTFQRANEEAENTII
jgi:hypothetical protein